MTSLMVVMAVLIACICGVSSVILLKNFDKQTNNKVLALQKRFCFCFCMPIMSKKDVPKLQFCEP